MNRKQLILLLAVLVVIGSAGLVLLNQHKQSWAVHESRMGDKVLPNFQPNDVAAIHVTGEAELNVVRTNNVWRVRERDDYPANFGQVSDLLIKLRDLKVVEAEGVGLADLGRVNLDPPGKGPDSGTLVEFKDAQGKVIQSLLLGKKHMHTQSETSHSMVGSEPDGRYILLPNDPQNVLLVSNSLAVLEPRPTSWLSRDFFKVEKLSSISFASPNPADSWKISRANESSPWTLVDAKPGETLDTAKISVTANALTIPRFTDVAPPKTPAEFGLDHPRIATLETFDHFTYTLKLGAKGSDDTYYLIVLADAEIPTNRVASADEKPEDKVKLDKEFQDKTKKLQDKLKQEKTLASWVYLVNTWIFDPLVRTRAQIMQGYKEQRSVTSEPVPIPQTTPDTVTNPGTPGWSPRVIK